MSRRRPEIGETFVVDNIASCDIIKAPRKKQTRGFAIYVTLKVLDYDNDMKGYKVKVIEHCGVYDSPGKDLLHRDDELWLKSTMVDIEFKRWLADPDKLWEKSGNAGKRIDHQAKREARRSVSKLWSSDL